MTSYDAHVWAWRRRRGMREWRTEYEAAGPQKHAADLSALHDAERHAARAAAALKPWQRRDVVSAAERAKRAAAHAAAAERCAALAASPVAEREAAGMPTVPAAELLAFAHAEWDEAAAFLPTVERARIEGAHSGPWRRPPEPSLRAARKLVRVSIVAARIVEHAGGPWPPGQYGAWAPAGAAHATWARAGAVWIAEHVGGRASATDTAEAAAWKARLTRKLAAVADLHATAARALALALDDLAGEQAEVQYARVRGHWLEVARDLPPDVRAKIMSRPRMPARPVWLPGFLARAADFAADEYGGALGALAAADDSAAGPMAAADAARRIAEVVRECAADGAELADIADYVLGAVDDAAAAAAERARAVRAACPAPADMVAAVRAAPVQDVGMRVVETAQFELAAPGGAPAQAPGGAPFQAPPARPTVSCLGAAGPRACTSAITVLMPAAGTIDGSHLVCRRPVAPPTLPPLYTAGPLALGLIDDLRAAVRPGVDLLALVRGRTRPRNDKDYEYARGTYAEQAASETVDISSTAKYIEAMLNGHLTKDMLAGMEFMGVMFEQRCNCGKPIPRGHKGDKYSGYEGLVELKPGLTSCNMRGCRRDCVRWLDKEALRMKDKIVAGVQYLRTAAGGAAGGKRTPILSIVCSVQPELHEMWASGPAGRARIRDAMVAEMHRRGRIEAWVEVDHSYRFKEDISGAYLSPHLHFLIVGWIDYETNAERFLKYKDVPYELRRMRMPAAASAPDGGDGRPAADGLTGLTAARPACDAAGGKRTIMRMYGLGRGMFLKHMSTIDTAEDVLYVCRYMLSHGTASSRRLGETSGGEHAARWGGAWANGRTQVVTASRYERGDLLVNARAQLPMRYTKLSIWHSAPSDEDDDTVSRADPRHVWTGSGNVECRVNLDLACADKQRDHPASAKNGGVKLVETYDYPDGPPAIVVEAREPTPEDGLSPDDYLILEVQGHSRPEADRMAAGAAKQAADTYRALNQDRRAVHVPGAAAADIAAATQLVQAAAQLSQLANRHADRGAVDPADGLRRQARAKLREVRGRLNAAVGCMYGNLHGLDLLGYADNVKKSERVVARALAISIEKSRRVVVRVNSRLDHLSSDGYRLETMVWDPGGAENAADLPALPSAIWEGLGMGALDDDDSADDDDRPVDARRHCAWLRTSAAGWFTVREWMQRYAEPYPPAYDPITRRLVLDDGVLVPSPHIDQAPIETQRAAAWDVIYSQVRAHKRASRGVDAGPVTREDVRAYVATHCMRPPTAVAPPGLRA